MNKKQFIEYDLSANWELNLFCNFRCKYCYNSIEHRTNPKFNGNDNIEKPIDFFNKSKKVWMIYLSGGEPFLYKRFIELCKKLTKKHYIGINTNLSSELVYKFAKKTNPERVVAINISLHIEEIRKRGLEDEFIKRVKLLREKGFFAPVHLVMYPPIFSEFKKIHEFYRSRGILIKPEAFKGNYNGKVYPQSYTKKESEFMKKYFNEFISNIEKKNIKRIFKQKGVKEIKSNLDLFDGHMSFLGTLCMAGYKHIIIAHNGNVQRCFSDKNIMGNIYNDNRIKLFEGPKPCTAKFCDCHYHGIQFALGKPKIVKNK